MIFPKSFPPLHVSRINRKIQINKKLHPTTSIMITGFTLELMFGQPFKKKIFGEFFF